MRHRLIITLAAFSIFPPVAHAAPTQPAAEAETRSIDRIAGDLYRWTAGSYHSVFLIHEKGILVGDPLSAGAARWLRGELARRFPGKPITHVIYSHNHPDHVYGGQELDGPGVRFIAHRLAKDDLVRTRAQTRIPDIAFDKAMSLDLGGGQIIDLMYHGTNNGRGSISMLFRPHKVLHVADWIVIGRMPYRDLKGYDLPGMIDSTSAVLALDFDRFVGAHGDIGSKADVRDYLGYLEALYAGTLEGIRQGRSLERIQRDLTLTRYRGLKQFDAWRKENIAGAYRQLVDEDYVLMRPDVPKP